MKVWIEFPEETRFARQPQDILYTPIYFANEKITGHLRLDNEWRSAYGDQLDQLFNARIKLIGKASLGFLSIGGKPVNGFDTRYALPNLGFKPIYTLEILNVFKRVYLSTLEYDVEDGVRGGRTPFSFQLPTSTLDDLQQLASSLKVVTADNVSTMDFLKGVTPALIVSVQYVLAAEMLDQEGQIKSTSGEEVRLFASLSEGQVPNSTEPAVVSNPMAAFVKTQVVSFTNMRSRRDSIPFIRRLSRSASFQDLSLITIDVEDAEPFVFTRQSDAAASKVTISLSLDSDGTPDPPLVIFGDIQWMLKTLTTLTLEPIDRGEAADQRDDYFHLRSKVLPPRKFKMKWSDWSLMPATATSNQPRWKSTQTVWLIKDLTSGMTPTFITPYLAHTYLLNLRINLVESDSKLSRGLSSSGKVKTELDVPVQIRYELGLVPSYEVDQTLPEYDHTLPEYEENELPGVVEADGDGNADADADAAADDDGLQDLANLDLNLVGTRDEDGTIPLRPRNRPPEDSALAE